MGQLQVSKTTNPTQIRESENKKEQHYCHWTAKIQRRAITMALTQLDLVIDANPTFASVWNNRAQARRLLFEVDQLDQHLDDLRMILSDLSEAIRLASPCTPAAPLSALNSRVLASAHTHRAYLLLTASRSAESARRVVSEHGCLRGLDPDRLEEMASRDFDLGGRYGNDTARQMAVKTNPYAKLCGSIVREALQKEMEEHYSMPSQHPK